MSGPTADTLKNSAIASTLGTRLESATGRPTAKARKKKRGNSSRTSRPAARSSRSTRPSWPRPGRLSPGTPTAPCARPGPSSPVALREDLVGGEWLRHRVPLAFDLPYLHLARQVLQGEETKAPEDETVAHPTRRLGREQDLAAGGAVAESSGKVRHRAAGGEGPALTRGPLETGGPDVALPGADADIDHDRWMLPARVMVGPGRLLSDRQRPP